MKWIPDPTGRFPQRPFYERDELDRECEQFVGNFLHARYGKTTYPLVTNDLEVLLEQEVEDLDLWADLSSDGLEVQGKTIFSPKGKPAVQITLELQDPNRENRLRTTLAHELGHVRFHNYLYGLHAGAPSTCCSDNVIIDASHVDWLEWQAGYCSGAFLMPLNDLRRTVRKAKRQIGFDTEPTVLSSEGQAFIHMVKDAYLVSVDAARVRLLQLKCLAE